MQKANTPGSKALRKGRFSQPGGIYFITVVSDQRIPWFQDHSLARIMARNLQDPEMVLGARVLCWVVMPDHFHLLVQLGDAGLSQVVRKLKARSAVLLNKEIGRKGRFWDPGFHDQGLREEDDVRGIARYIVGNPLRAKLANRVGDYPYWNAIWM
ncbi:MAG: transposase [Xanthomonadales bacterium]|jgi:REP element-mobilizing transposase RayT|nr:transposase [Xanthomonadales bacterium]